MKRVVAVDEITGDALRLIVTDGCSWFEGGNGHRYRCVPVAGTGRDGEWLNGTVQTAEPWVVA